MQRDHDNATRPQPLPLLRQPGPNEWEVQQVMRDLGFDYMQARNHVRCRELLRNMPARRRFD